MLSLLLTTSSARAQSIRDLNAQLKISASGDVTVVEDLRINFSPRSQRNQFYRILPIWYERSGDIHIVDVNVKSVVMDDNLQVPFQSWLSGRDLFLRVGDPVTPLQGEHRFRIEYEIFRGVHFINGTPQLLVNVVGEENPFPIENVSVTITPPNGTDMGRVLSSARVEGNGKNQPIKASAGGEKIEFQAQQLAPSQGLTVSIDLPKGSVIPHSVLFDVVAYIQRFYQVFVLPVATVILLSAWWWLYGRDPGEKKVDSPGFLPPDFITPAEAGTLVDESCDLTDLASSVIDLAARGFIKIRVIPYNGFLYLDTKDYEFTLIKSAQDRELKPHEQLFLTGLFGGLSSTTYLSAVKGNFAEYLPLLKRKVYANLVTEGLFARDPEIDRKNFVSAGTSIITVGVCFMVLSIYHAGGQATSIGMILSGLVILLAAGAMPRRTSKGVSVHNQLKRFQRMLLSGEQSDLQKFARENPNAFDKYLSYAIVLGLADRWADAYIGEVVHYPDWYQLHPALVCDGFDARAFVSQLHDSLSIINRALTEPPYNVRSPKAHTLLGSRR
jgi:hypothetical protein